eukprot:795860-Rhodomonas_salina.1
MGKGVRGRDGEEEEDKGLRGGEEDWTERVSDGERRRKRRSEERGGGAGGGEKETGKRWEGVFVTGSEERC